LKKFKAELEAIDRKNSGYNYRYLKNLNEDDEKSKIKRKIELIENYPIPNNKEDIKEFMILASSNFDANVYNKNLEVEDISDAWLAKIEQCYQKARMLLDDRELAQIKEMYDCVKRQIGNETKNNQTQKTKNTSHPFFESGLGIVDMLLMSFAILFLMVGINASNVAAAILSVLSAISTGASMLFGTEYIKYKNKMMVVATMALGAILLIISYCVII
jgi:hypothetical protein